MTVKETLISDLMKYPSIHKNKWDVFHQWFIVNGNGMEWKNGELVDIYDNKPVTIEESIIKHVDFYITESLSEILDEDKDKRVLEIILNGKIDRLKKDIINSFKWEERMNDFTSDRIEDIYPLCEYSKILNIPDDVKPDWKEAAIEMLSWLIENYDKLGEENQKYINMIKIN